MEAISIHALREEGDREIPWAEVLEIVFLSTPSARRATRALCQLLLHLVISIHALREEGDPPPCKKDVISLNFYPRPPRGGRPVWAAPRPYRWNFYPRPPRGGRQKYLGKNGGDKYFYPRPPRGGRRREAWECRISCTHFYPRPPRGGRPGLDIAVVLAFLFLSTPSARRATYQQPPLLRTFPISIHALREEGDATSSISLMAASIFLSTPSARRATVSLVGLPDIRLYFYPRPPRGGRRHPTVKNPPQNKISIHALREEGDRTSRARKRPDEGFLSTPSARRATTTRKIYQQLRDISIHALREEGDPDCWYRDSWRTNFYPRPPRGGRPVPSKVALPSPNFYPRPPRGGRRNAVCFPADHIVISIHALREEGDLVQHQLHHEAGTISIHALREEGDPEDQRPQRRRSISIHALREEGDGLPRFMGPEDVISIHALREEGDLLRGSIWTITSNFYPRPPRGGRPPALPALLPWHTISIHALREEGDPAQLPFER